MNNLYKKGDMVIVLDGHRIKDYAGGWEPEMTRYAGRTFVVDRAFECRGLPAYNLMGCGDIIFDERGLASKKQQIYISRNGSKVIAIDKTTGKRAEAICSPDDTFDFMMGAKLALERLSEKPAETAETESEPRRKFKVGDHVIGNAKATDRYKITQEGWRGVVSELIGAHEICVIGGDDSFAVCDEYFDLDDEYAGASRAAAHMNLTIPHKLSDADLFDNVEALIGKRGIERLVGYLFKSYHFSVKKFEIDGGELTIGEKRCGK